MNSRVGRTRPYAATSKIVALIICYAATTCSQGEPGDGSGIAVAGRRPPPPHELPTTNTRAAGATSGSYQLGTHIPKDDVQWTDLVPAEVTPLEPGTADEAEAGGMHVTTDGTSAGLPRKVVGVGSAGKKTATKPKTKPPPKSSKNKKQQASKPPPKGNNKKASPPPKASPSPTPSPEPVTAGAGGSSGSKTGTSPATPQYSRLWGQTGELFNLRNRLDDYSWAGYGNGSAPQLPSPPATADVKRDYGAVGDGISDDTAAFEKAFSTMKQGVLYVPAGTYVISRNLSVVLKPLVLRGAGRDLTTLLFTKSFKDLYPAAYKADPSVFSNMPGFIRFQGYDPVRDWTRAAFITANTTRGDRLLNVSSTSKISVGQWLRVAAGDVNGNLISYLYGGASSAPASSLTNTPVLLQFLAPVRAVYPDRKQVELARPVPFDLNTRWFNLSVHTWQPYVQQVGVEHLTFKFSWSPYSTHLEEAGYNALMIEDVPNSWVRSVRFTNCDYALLMYSTVFSTVADVVVDMERPRAQGAAAKQSPPYNGHHGIGLAWAQDNLLQNVLINTSLVHDLSLDRFSMSNVVKASRGLDLNLDFHKAAPSLNLLAGMDCGACSRPLAHGGAEDAGQPAGMYNTLWGWTSRTRNLSMPSAALGNKLTFVGVPLGSKTSPPSGSRDWYIEDLDPGRLEPLDLHAAQLQRRLASNGTWP